MSNPPKPPFKRSHRPFRFFGYLHFIVAIVFIVALRIKYSHLTETELLVRCWPAWLGIFAMLVSGAFWATRRDPE